MYDASLGMMWRSRRAVAVAVLSFCGVVALPAATVAAPPGGERVADKEDKKLAYPSDPRALVHFKAGVSHYNLRDFDRAIAEFKLGAAIEPAPIFFFNLGQASREIGDHSQAIWFFRRTVAAYKPTAPQWLVSMVDARVSAVEEERKATASKPASPSSEPPPPEPVQAHELVDSQQPSANAAPTVPQPSRSEPAATPRSGGRRRLVGWGLVAGGALLGVGAGLAAWSATDLDAQADSTRRERERAALYDSAETRATIAVVGGIAAGAAIVAGVAILLTGSRSAEVGSTPLALTVTPNHAAFSAVVEF